MAPLLSAASASLYQAVASPEIRRQSLQ